MTPKQERFCQVYVETGNASEAYRQAYDAENMQPQTVNRKAHELTEDGKITARIEALMAAAAERHDITMDRITAMLLEDRRQAKENTQMGAAISAVNSLAKLHGLMVDKAESKVIVSNPTALPIPETFEDVLRYVDAVAKTANGRDDPENRAEQGNNGQV
jgi:phage terminase small subunit